MNNRMIILFICTGNTCRSPMAAAFLQKMLDEKGLKTDIEVDGGIYHANVAEVLDAGANIMVSGSGIFKGDIRKNTEEFMEILKSHE